MKSIGIDIGTTSIGGILYDVDKNKILLSISKPNPLFINTKNDWEKIQDVNKIISISFEILDSLIDGDICSIGVTGQMHGIVYFDRDGNAVSPLYTWQDGRGNLSFNEDKTYAEFLNSFSGYGCVTDFYNQLNKLRPSSAVDFCTIHDYFVMKLCGLSRPIVHSTNAASFGCYNVISNTFTYNTNITVTSDFFVVGKYKNIPVAVAIGDNQASVLGSAKEDALLVNVGTGSQVSIITKNSSDILNSEVRPFFENKFLRVGCALCGGKAYSLLKDLFKEILSKKNIILDDEVYQIMNDFLTQSSPSLKCDTRFSGTRLNPDLKGNITNISDKNFTAGNLCHAVLDGIADELRFLSQSFLEKRDFVVASGNGVRKNNVLLNKLSEKFERKIKIPKITEEACFGAVLFSLISIGKFNSVYESQNCLQYIDN